MNARIPGFASLTLTLLLVGGLLSAGGHPMPRDLFDELSPRQLTAHVNTLLLAVAPTPTPDAGAALDLQARVDARSKMSPRLAAMVAAGDARTLRVEAILDASPIPGERTALDADRLLTLGARIVAHGADGVRLVDVPGDALDAFALDRSVRRLAFVAVVEPRQQL